MRKTYDLPLTTYETFMPTEVIQVDASCPDRATIARAAAVLRQGGLVAFPTETVYGLGANALDAAAVARIFAAKGRPATNPLIVHVADSAAAGDLVSQWPEEAQRLAARFWPGPLTLVLPGNDRVPPLVTAGGPTVALRVPAHPVALALLRAAGVPIAAPSANRSASLSPTLASHVLRDLEGFVDVLLDGGPTPGGLESTVLDLTTRPCRLLRPGLIAPGELEAVVGPIQRPGAYQAATQDLPERSPGRQPRHYAPQTPLECTSDDGRQRALELCRQGLRVGWLTFTPPAGPGPPALVTYLLPAEPAACAAQLYAALHTLDLANLDRLVAALPPPTEEWLAVHDRLRRASAPKVPD